MFKSSHIDCIKYLNALVVFQNPNSPSKNWNFITVLFNQCQFNREDSPRCPLQICLGD